MLRLPTRGRLLAASTIGTMPSALRLADHVSSRIPGNSRFAAEVRGRDTVERHLAAMGVRWEQVRNTRAAFALGANEAAWLVMVHAAQRNLQQVRAIHGTGGHTRFLAASRGRVLAILDEVVPAGHAPQLVQYRFDASGRVSSLHAVLPQGLSCCNSSGSNEIYAFMITPP